MGCDFGSGPLFGTDGIRGRVGVPPITVEGCLQLGWVIGTFVRERGGSQVLVGRDPRNSGDLLESLVVSGLVASGMNVLKVGVFSTPGIAYLTQETNADLGIAISASHNGYQDNGFKFFNHDGEKLSRAEEQLIESKLNEPLEVTDTQSLGQVLDLHDAADLYQEFCLSTIEPDVSLKGMRIVLDCANGACSALAPPVFERLNASVSTIGNHPNGVNINQGGSTNPEVLREAVQNEGADIGFAFDGDGDRVITVDHDGKLLDGDYILYGLAKCRNTRDGLHGGVVGTVMSNLGFEISLAMHDIPFCRTPVGDRYVLEKLLELDWKLGGETSGHVICHSAAHSGDGIITALQVLQVYWQTGVPFGKFVSDMQHFPQVLLNIQVDDPASLSAHPQILDYVQAFQREFGKDNRVLVRPSGTEPVVRIMVEGSDRSFVEDQAERIASLVTEIDAK